MRQIDVHFLPELPTEEELAGSTAVVIDVLRATTTIVYALAAGASEVRMCLEVADAQRIAKEYPADQAVLGGERGGLKIDGFGLGNSPSEYTPEVVAGKSIVFTTTNGTRAAMRCAGANRVLLGSFVNRMAITQAIQDEPRVNLICAGTRGQITREDVILAGALVELQTGPRMPDHEMNDQAEIAQEAWSAAIPMYLRDDKINRREALVHALRSSHGGRNLMALGLEADLTSAAQIDKFDLVPVVDTKTWKVTGNLATSH